MGECSEDVLLQNENKVKRPSRVNTRDIRHRKAHVTYVRWIKEERKCESGNAIIWTCSYPLLK